MIRFLALNAFAAAVGVAASASAHASLKCKPDISVNNNKTHAIKVLRVEYTTGGKAYNEGLANKTLARNTSGLDDQHTWKSQTLPKVAVGNPITATRIEYKEDNSGSGDGFGPARWSGSFAHTGDCSNSRTYGHTIE
jgi:hypothetical protein